MAMTSDRQKFLIQSFRDPLHPTTLCTMSGANFRLISRTEIGYATTSSQDDPIRGTSVIGRMSLSELKPVAVVEVQGLVMDFAWSPDGSSIAYLVYLDAAENANQLWLKSGAASARALTPQITFGGRGGSIDDETIVRFSPDGKYLLMADTYLKGAAPSTPEHAQFQVRAMPAGDLVWVPPTALTSGDKIGYSFVTMAVWSRTGHRLYYRDQTGVHAWDPAATVETRAAGLTWYSPSISPDGHSVAYAVNMREQPHVEVRELVSNKVQVIPGVRAEPFFVAPRTLFVAEYAPSTQPGPGVQAYSRTGRALVFDLLTNVETPVAMVKPIDYWPR
jgi:hypothetical protein